MDKDKLSKYRMYKHVAIKTVKLMLFSIAVLIVLLLLFHYKFEVNSLSLLSGIVGSILVFIGGSLTSDALSRLGASKLAHYKIGTWLQSLGLGITLFALVIK